MRRATYAIPLLGVGMSLSACADPIVDDFDVTIFGGITLPFEFAETDPQTGVTCTAEASATMSVDAALQAEIAINSLYQCDDNSVNETYALTYTGTVTIEQKKSSYTISLALQEETIALDCIRDSEGAVRCASQDGLAFAFEPKE